MRRETKAERAAWTAFVEGTAVKVNKYGNERTKAYASLHEAEAAGKYAALERAGIISELKEQDRIILVPGDGKLRPITWIADFTFMDRDGVKHYVDAKGFKTQVYRLKKRLAALLLGITIEEV